MNEVSYDEEPQPRERGAQLALLTDITLESKMRESISLVEHAKAEHARGRDRDLTALPGRGLHEHLPAG